jgi:hypothetical protein
MLETFLLRSMPWLTTVNKSGEKLDDPTVNVDKFVQLFLEGGYFERDFALYDVLLVQNRWLDMQVCVCANRRLKGAFAEIQHTSAYASIRLYYLAYADVC